MSINDINNAAAAMNQLKARYEGFLDDADAQIANRRASYDELASDLVEIVKDRMRVTIYFDPNAEAADLSNGGVFRTWQEFLSFINPLPSLAYVKVIMQPGQLVVDQNYYSHIYGSINLEFRANVNQPAGQRPSLFFVLYDKVNFNQWRRIETGELGSFYGHHIDFYFDENINEAVNPSSNNILFGAKGRGGQVELVSCMVKGPTGTHLMTCSTGDVSSLSLNSVLLDGITFGLQRSGDRGVALLTCDVVTVANGAEIYDSAAFTVGQNLLTSVVTV